MTCKNEKFFKELHIDAGLSKHYATDLDLVFVDKHPKRISAFVDFKNPDEPIKFTQSIVFEKLSDIADVYIIRSEDPISDLQPSEHRFNVLRFIETIDSREDPPVVDTELIDENISWGGLIEHASRRKFLKNGGDGLIGWEHEIRYPERTVTDTQSELIMPSRHSPASQSSEYDTDAAKILETKNDMTINSIIKGMTDVERIDHWIRTEAEGQCRKEIIGKLNRRKMELEE